MRKIVGVVILAVFGSAISACETAEPSQETVQAPEPSKAPREPIENAQAASDETAQIDVEMEVGDLLNIVLPSWWVECVTPADYIEAVTFPEGSFTWEIEYREHGDLQFAQYFPLPPGVSPMDAVLQDNSMIWVEAAHGGFHAVTVTFTCQESGQSETHTKGVFVS